MVEEASRSSRDVMQMVTQRLQDEMDKIERRKARLEARRQKLLDLQRQSQAKIREQKSQKAAESKRRQIPWGSLSMSFMSLWQGILKKKLELDAATLDMVYGRPPEDPLAGIAAIPGRSPLEVLPPSMSEFKPVPKHKTMGYRRWYLPLSRTLSRASQNTAGYDQFPTLSRQPRTVSVQPRRCSARASLISVQPRRCSARALLNMTSVQSSRRPAQERTLVRPKRCCAHTSNSDVTVCRSLNPGVVTPTKNMGTVSAADRVLGAGKGLFRSAPAVVPPRHKCLGLSKSVLVFVPPKPGRLTDGDRRTADMHSRMQMTKARAHPLGVGMIKTAISLGNLQKPAITQMQPVAPKKQLPAIHRQLKTPRTTCTRRIFKVDTKAACIKETCKKVNSSEQHGLQEFVCKRDVTALVMPGRTSVRQDFKQSVNLFLMNGAHDVDYIADLWSYPGSKFAVNAFGLMFSFNLDAVSVVPMVAGPMLGKMKVPRAICLGHSKGGMWAHMMQIAMERSSACDLALATLDNLAQPSFFFREYPFRCGERQLLTTANRDRVYIPDKNIMKIHRTNSSLIQIKGKWLYPGCLNFARDFHESFSVASFKFEFTLAPDDIDHQRILSAFQQEIGLKIRREMGEWDVARKVRGEMDE